MASIVVRKVYKKFYFVERLQNKQSLTKLSLDGVLRVN